MNILHFNGLIGKSEGKPWVLITFSGENLKRHLPVFVRQGVDRLRQQVLIPGILRPERLSNRGTPQEIKRSPNCWANC